MKAHLIIKNYRCFIEPARIEVGRGFTSFVGVNNAGKSALMRFLVEFRNLFGQIGSNSNFLSSLLGGQSFNPTHVSDPQEIFSNLNEREIEFWFEFSHDQQEDKNKLLPDKILITAYRNLSWRTKIFFSSTEMSFSSKVNYRFAHFRLLDGTSPKVDLSEFFQIVSDLSDTLYIPPFRNTINIGTRANYGDIQIGEAFINQFRALKEGNKKEENRAISRLTEDIRKIFEFESLVIGTSEDGQSLHFDVNHQPYKQHELGSGLLQFVLVLANASIRRPSYILIDEPELNLHPRLQLDFLTTLGSYAKNGVWFSTHSIGLARSAAERIYSVLRQEGGKSIIRYLERTPRLAEFLGEMSFSAHKDLGFEKILLVEGSTEVKTIQQFLRKLRKDHQVVILPLNGRINGKMEEELEEVRRITMNIFILIDSERSSAGQELAKQRKDFVDLCSRLKLSCHVLDYRATENYFPDHVVRQVFGDQYRALGSFETLKNLVPNWGKEDNWRLAAAMSREELFETDLGKFLESI